MRKLSVGLLSLLFICVTVTVPAQNKTLLKQKQRLTHLNRNIKQLKTSIANSEKKQTVLLQSLAKSEIKIGRTSQNITAIEHSLSKQQHKIDKLEQKIASQQSILNQEQSVFAHEMRSAYMMGRLGYLKLLLSQQDPNLVNRMLAYYQYIANARTAQIKKYHTQLTQLNHNQQTLQKEVQQLQAIKINRIQKKRDLQNQLSTRKQLYRELKKDIAKRGDRLKFLMNNRKSLEAVISRLGQQALFRSTLPFAKMMHRLPWPVRGKLAQRYGTRVSQSRLISSGVLIAAPAGKKIRAIYPGKVIFANWLRGYGLLMIISHGNGYMTLYAHNQSFLKPVGSTVKAGELIATIGNSGTNQKNGLYFEIRHNGKPLNPMRWLA
jgi:murein hydrolase activator